MTTLEKFIEFRSDNKNASCGATSKPCKGLSGKVVCIPRNSSCRSETQEKARVGAKLKEGAAFIGGGLATGLVVGTGAAIADKLVNGKRSGGDVTINNKVDLISKIREKAPEERTPEEKTALKKQKESIVSNVLVRKAAKSLGLDLNPEEEDAFAADLKEMLDNRRKSKK